MPVQVLEELQDGFVCRIRFSADATVEVKTISSKPPGFSGSGGISQTTMENVQWMTQLPGALIKVSDMTEVVAYAPAAFVKIAAMMLVNQLIAWDWPNAKFGSLWGWIETWEPGELVIGGKPTGTITILVSCIDDAGAEVGPSHNLDTDPIT